MRHTALLPSTVQGYWLQLTLGDFPGLIDRNESLSSSKTLLLSNKAFKRVRGGWLRLWFSPEAMLGGF